MIKRITNKITIIIFIITLLVSLSGSLFISSRGYASGSRCKSQSQVAMNYGLCDFQGYFSGSKLTYNGYGWALFDTAYGQPPSSTCSSVFYTCDSNGYLNSFGFISDIQAYLNSSDSQNQEGAAFIIDTMLSSTPQSISYAQSNFSTWENLVNEAVNNQNGLSVKFNAYMNYPSGFGNSMYEYTTSGCTRPSTGCSGEDVFYTDSSSMNNYNSIVFYYKGNPIYYIKKNCGNIVDNSKALLQKPPQITYAIPSLIATCQLSGSQESINFSATPQPSNTSLPTGFTPNIDVYNTNPLDFAVGMAATPDGGGYWVVTNLGQVYPFGDAPSLGGISSSTKLNAPIVGMAATPDGDGYWLVGADGGVFSFGDAKFQGSLGSTTVLNAPIVGMAANSDGKGYWLVGADGQVYPFGDAPSLGGISSSTKLNAPIVGMAATSDGKGYWLVGADGGVFRFGDAKFYGSLGSTVLNARIVGMAATPDGGGYWLVGADGGVFAGPSNGKNFGSAIYQGRVKSLPVQSIISVTSLGTYSINSNDLSATNTYYIFSNYSNPDYFTIKGCLGSGGGQTSYNQPYFQVNGSDVSTGMEFCNDNLVSFAQYQWPWSAPIESWGTNSSNSNEPGGQYGVFASGVIDGFLSALNSTNFNPLALSFSNNSNNTISNNQFGGNFKSLPPCMYNYFDNHNNPNVTKLLSSSINLNKLSGSYYYTSSPNSYTDIILNKSTIPSGKDITLYVNGNVTIKGNIKYSTPSPSKLSDISQFRLVVQGNIYIASSVTEIDGIYIAQPVPNIKNNILYSGYIYTCSSGASSIMYQYTCKNNNQLTVNGALSASNIKLLRPFGNIGTTGPAESINYSPLVWLPDINNGSLQVDKIESLPPVL